MSKLKNMYIILLYGFIWGIVEITLGTYLHFIHFPYKGHLLSAIGCSIVALYIIKHNNPRRSIWIGVVAASFKFLNIIIYNIPFLHRSIINPAISIIFEAIAISIFVPFITKAYSFKHFGSYY